MDREGYVVDHTLKRLGIMLLELCFGETIEEQDIYRRYSNPSGEPSAREKLACDFLTACDWSLSVQEEAGPEFADAIKWCLAELPRGAYDGERLDQWCGEMLENVVLPLKSCLRLFVR